MIRRVTSASAATRLRAAAEAGEFDERCRRHNIRVSTAWRATDLTDVVHLNRGRPVIRQRALGRGSTGLCQSAPGASATAQAAALTERSDTDRVRWLNRELPVE